MRLALLVIAILLIAGGLAVGGVFLLVGPGWAMLAAAAVLVGYAWLLRMGLTANG